MKTKEENQKQNDGYIVDDSGYLIQIVNGDKYVRMCPFSEGSIRNHGSQGIVTESNYMQKSQCGDWCALFEHKMSRTVGTIPVGEKIILHCSSRTIDIVN